MKRARAGVDLECFSNWFHVGITCEETGATWDYSMTPLMPLNIDGIVALLQHFQMLTFNGKHYDELMLCAALQGYDNAQLKRLNDYIVTSGKRAWEIRRETGLYAPDWLDHVDMFDVAPGVNVGLKVYAGRLHTRTMFESPVDFRVPLPMQKAAEEIAYCINDRKVTIELAKACASRMKLREGLTRRYGVDLRSKSDAQIAEAAIQAEWIRRMGDSLARWNVTGGQGFPHQQVPYELDNRGNIKVKRRVIPHGYSFKFEPAPYIHFVTPEMQRIFEDIKALDFVVSDKEQAVQFGADPEEKIKTGVVMPDYLRKLVINLGGARYKMGIGGLHSQESNAAHCTVFGIQQLRTADVASYYPSLMIKLGMYPDALGPLFSEIFLDFYTERLDAKARAKQLGKLINATPEEVALLEELLTTEGGLKIVLNGTFGKLWSKYSIFFAPEQGIRVTLNGQLALLMLIERLHLAGIRTVSANTDGIEMLIPWARRGIADEIVRWWEQLTELTMEQKDYEGLYSRDVNNYIRVDGPDDVKRKGVYRPSGVLDNKTPKHDICAEAVVQWLSKKKPISDTIRECRDIRQFVEVRKAGNGGVYHTPQNPVVDGEGGEYLGKAVRWYYAKNRAGCFIVTDKGSQVAGSEGCRPLMTLPDVFPDDVDVERYIAIAEVMVEEIGFGLKI